MNQIEFGGRKGTFMCLPVNQLLLENGDDGYQRTDIKQNNIDHIREHFHWGAFGILMVSRRDEKYYVYDGQHRLYALLQMLYEGLVPCLVFDYESIQEEADVFYKVNKFRSAVSSTSQVRARIVSGEDRAMKMGEYLRQLGYRFGNSGEHNLIKFASKFEEYWRKSEEVAKEIFALCAKLAKVERKQITQFTFVGLCQAELHLRAVDQTLLKDPYVLKLKQLGYTGLEQAIRQQQGRENGSRKANTLARGVLNWLNTKCKGRQLCNLFEE